jgi:small-conductance mechanosensitive channel
MRARPRILRVAPALGALALGARTAPALAAADVLRREPLGYDRATLERVGRALLDLPAHAGAVLDQLVAEGRTLGVGASILIALLLVAIAYGIFGQRRFAAWLDVRLAPVTSQLPPAGARWAAAGARILGAGALPLALWGLHAAVGAALAYQPPAFLLVGTLLLAWTRFALLATALRELLVGGLLPVSPEHGRALYRMGWWLLVYGVLLDALLEALAVFAPPRDLLALLRSAFTLSLILFLTGLLARKRAVLALFPDVPNQPYRLFVRGLARVYVPVVALTAATALLAWAGYHRLARVILVRSWALVGLFLAAVLVHHVLRTLLRRRLLRPETAARNERLYRSSVRLLDYLGVIGVVVAALWLTDLGDSVLRALATPVYRLGGREVRLLMLAEAVAIVLAVLIVSRLLRDYLAAYVYPALHVDEGIADAIDTFLAYFMVLIGGLIALQVVGVGPGVLAVFAGAVGVGLGFGLQGFANNLVSGLTLVFGRALRKGDWVTVGDSIGVIEEVGIRATRIRTRDALDYLVPNAELVNGTIVNWTHSSKLVRRHVPVGVSYGADPEAVRGILLAVAARHPQVEDHPAPEVWFVGFGDSSLDFELLVWIRPKRVAEHAVRSDLYFAIFAAFKEAGIEIPFPQRDLHVRSLDAAVARALSGRRGE